LLLQLDEKSVNSRELCSQICRNIRKFATKLYQELIDSAYDLPKCVIHSHST